MNIMFDHATSFNGDISKWDVSKVSDMWDMFKSASKFAQTLCGAWKASTAKMAVNRKREMFKGSSGKICEDVDECKTNNGGCHSKRTCTNTAGSITCGDCPAGYVNDGAKGCKKGGWAPKSNAEIKSAIAEFL